MNVQFQPASVGALSQLTPLITAAGATVQATTISGLYEVQGPAANLNQLAEELSANPAVQYAAPAQTVQDLTVPNDPDYTNGDQWQLNGTWGINAPGAWNVTTGSDQVIVADTDTGHRLQRRRFYRQCLDQPGRDPRERAPQPDGRQRRWRDHVHRPE